MGGTRQRKSGTGGTTLLYTKVKSLASWALPGPSLFHLSGVLFHLSFHLAGHFLSKKCSDYSAKNYGGIIVVTKK